MAANGLFNLSVHNPDITHLASGFDKVQQIVKSGRARRRHPALQGSAAEQIKRSKKEMAVSAAQRAVVRAEASRIAARRRARIHADLYAARSLARYYELRHDPDFRRRMAAAALRYAEKRPLIWRAHDAVAKAVKRGELAPVTSLSCVDCGKAATDYDHRDYLKPLVVEPTCHRCNLRRGPGSPYVDDKR